MGGVPTNSWLNESTCVLRYVCILRYGGVMSFVNISVCCLPCEWCLEEEDDFAGRRNEHDQRLYYCQKDKGHDRLHIPILPRPGQDSHQTRSAIHRLIHHRLRSHHYQYMPALCLASPIIITASSKSPPSDSPPETPETTHPRTRARSRASSYAHAAASH